MKSRQKKRSTASSKATMVSPVRADRRANTWDVLLACTVLVLLVVLSYANSLHNGFTWDDHQQIVMNPSLRPGADVGRLFSAGVWGYLHRGSATSNIYYRPLQMATYRAVVAIAGVNPTAFHAISLAFAAVSVLMAFGFFWKLSGRMVAAFAAAALFAVHPIHTEAVDWASALPDIGCTLFVVAAFTFFLFTLGGDSAGHRAAGLTAARWLLWTLSLVSFAAALLWKETAAVFPLLIAVYVVLVHREVGAVKRAKRALLLSLPFWIVLAGYLMLRFRLLGVIASSQRNWELSPLGFTLTAFDLMLQYWWKLVAPARLNAYHVFSPVNSLVEIRAVAGVLFVVLACVLVVYAARRTPLAAFSAAWVFVSLLPVMDIYAVGRNVFAERYLYLPSVGFCLLVTLLVAEVLQRVPVRFRRWASIAALAVIVTLFASATVARNPDWKDDATLFGRTLETSPNAAFAHIMVAAAESDHPATIGSAEEHYQQAAQYASAEVPPNRLQMAIAYKGLASIYSERSDCNRALDMLARVREIDPTDAEVDGEQGLILTKAGRWDEAAPYLQKAVAASPQNANAWNALGILAQQRSHQLDQAAAYFLRALAIHTVPDGFRASVHNNLGTVYGEQRRYSDAIGQFKSAIAILPDDLEYRTNLATALAAGGRSDEARAELSAILANNPDYEPARAVLQQLDKQ